MAAKAANHVALLQLIQVQAKGREKLPKKVVQLRPAHSLHGLHGLPGRRFEFLVSGLQLFHTLDVG